MEPGFHLRLSDGQQWSMFSSPGALSWVTRLATIMRLEPGANPDDNRLCFTRRHPRTRSRSEADRVMSPYGRHFASGGWETHDVRIVKFVFRPDFREVHCELGKEDSADVEYLMMGEALLPIFRNAARRGGIPFHSALVVKDGQGILLGGPGNVGKSTCARRIPPPWRALSDDESLIVKTGAGRYSVHPFPTWSDYIWRRSERTWQVEESAPLKAIFFIEQGERDEATRLGQGKSAVMVNQLAGQVCAYSLTQLPRSEIRAFRLGFFANAAEITRSVPCFSLKVSLRGQFWREIERALGL